MSTTQITRPASPATSVEAEDGVVDDMHPAPFAPVPAIHPRDAAACYICGRAEHPPTDEHAFWSNAEADREFSLMPAGPMPSMTAVETLDPREAVVL